MKTWEALKALENGKKVRLKYWESGRYIYRTENGRILDNTEDIVFINLTSGIIDEEWELYDDEKMITISEAEGKVIKLSGRYYYVPPFASKIIHLNDIYERCYMLVPMELSAKDSGKFIALNANWTGKTEVKNISAFK